jgi:hypothetical protein
VLLTAGPVYVGGTVDFALTRQTVDVDSDGNGAPDLLGARLDVVALEVVSGVTVEVEGVATVTLSSGHLALARVTAAGESTARYTALKMGDVTVGATVSGSASTFGLQGALTIDALDYNGAAAGFARIDWTGAFDLDGDGAADIVDLGTELSPASQSTATVSIVGLPGTLITGGVVRDANGNLWDLPATVTIEPDGDVDVTVTARVAGAIAAPAGTITGIHTPQAGWQSVTNALAATLGDPVVDLAIDLPATLQFALAGSVTGSGTSPSGETTNVLLTAAPVYVGGTVDFALSRRTVDVDSDGNGAADLIDATLDEVALSVASPLKVEVDGVATVTLSSGQLALARVTAAGQSAARYTALKMGNVTVSVTTDASDSVLGLEGALTITS